MPTKYLYSKMLYNQYLGVTKEIKAQTSWELSLKIDEQERKWTEQETRQREKARVLNLIKQADDMNFNAIKEQEEYHNLLSSALKKSYVLNWDTMMQKKPFQEFQYSVLAPVLEGFFIINKVPKQSFIEKIFKSVKVKRLERENAAKLEYDKAVEDYDNAKSAAYKLYEKAKSEYEQAQKEHNDSINLWKEQFEQGDALAIEKYLGVIFAESHYPEGISAECECFYDIVSKSIVVSFNLPAPEDISYTTGYKFIEKRKAIEPITLKQKDKAELYESIIQQIALRTIYEIFTGVYVQDLIENVVFNGWVSGINKATGKDFSACILSVQAGRQEFNEINLHRVEAKQCLRGLKALSAGSLVSLAPVKPIMDMSRDDKRFVASIDVLDAMDADTNLATMPWEEFEHLVRELFGKIFSKDGSEVRVTQASRDGGVDAIAFDPDPIRGGKFVIQAKRYNNVVPVSACRDLYGTMINEGAVKGILVTTSHYGSDSRQFVKDKPITLIDGANLVHMLDEYGYDFQKMQHLVALLPWKNNITLMSKIKDDNERDWYIKRSGLRAILLI